MRSTQVWQSKRIASAEVYIRHSCPLVQVDTSHVLIHRLLAWCPAEAKRQGLDTACCPPLPPRAAPEQAAQTPALPPIAAAASAAAPGAAAISTARLWAPAPASALSDCTRGAAQLARLPSAGSAASMQFAAPAAAAASGAAASTLQAGEAMPAAVPAVSSNGVCAAPAAAESTAPPQTQPKPRPSLLQRLNAALPPPKPRRRSHRSAPAAAGASASCPPADAATVVGRAPASEPPRAADAVPQAVPLERCAHDLSLRGLPALFPVRRACHNGWRA